MTNEAETPSITNEKKQPCAMFGALCKLLPERYTKRYPTVAVIRLSGIIGSGRTLFAHDLSLETVGEQIEAAFALPRLKAVALAVNSPGGSPVQTELIYKRIRALAAEKNVPVITFVESVAASGGYWLACSSDEIFASENSVVGSIGVIAAGFGFPEVMKKIGVERRIYTQGENKSILDPFLPEKKSDRDLLLSLQKDIHESFKNLVRERRKDKLMLSEEKLFNGEFWTGKRALEYGLIDGIGDLHSVIKERYGDKITLKKMETRKGWLKRKLSISGVAVSVIDAVLSRVEERISWSRFGL
jgi:signal peptide peptidase SppA